MKYAFVAILCIISMGLMDISNARPSGQPTYCKYSYCECDLSFIWCLCVRFGIISYPTDDNQNQGNDRRLTKVDKETTTTTTTTETPTAQEEVPTQEELIMGMTRPHFEIFAMVTLFVGSLLATCAVSWLIQDCRKTNAKKQQQKNAQHPLPALSKPMKARPNEYTV